MKLAVFGATGGTGKIVVEKALAAGHTVSVLARKPEAIGAARDRLIVVQGDANDVAAVERALAGADVAIHVIGSGNMKATTLRTDTARTIATASKKLGVKRVIAMSGMGAGDSMQQMPFIVRKIVGPLVLKALLVDQSGLEREIAASGVDWIVVRPGQLVDGASTGGKPSLSTKGMKTKVARADVADFILANLESREWIGKAPMLG